jgi:molecular chaperone DnaK (HSP70)
VSDRVVATKLARDLDRAGLGVWFDEWEIKVGDSIIDKINSALQTNDGLIVLFSPEALASEALRRQLNAASVLEIETRQISVLPVIAKPCNLPPLLRDRKPADFCDDYRSGLTQLLLKIAPELVEQRLRRDIAKVVGIDFGTGTSLIATIEDGRPIIIPNRMANRITPTVIARSLDGEWLVGEPALAQAEANPQRTFFAVKRQLGTDFAVDLDGKKYMAWQLAAVILEQLRQDAEAYLGCGLKGAVLGCPAYFTRSMRRDLLRAAELAEIPVVRLLAEPSAAILANGLHVRAAAGPGDNVLVFDLGAGSFDVSIANVGDGVVEILSLCGDNHLGGYDFDGAIADWCRARFRERYGTDIADERGIRRLLLAAERAKVALSSAATATVFVPSLATKEGTNEWLDLCEKIDLETFERQVNGLVNRTIECSKRAVESLPKYHGNQPLTVLLSGLPTRTPIVRQRLRETFNTVPITRIDPDEAVALGAALQACIASGDLKNELLLDAVPMDIGIKLSDGVFMPLIEANCTYPTLAYEYLHISCQADALICIDVYEGNGDNFSVIHKIGSALYHTPLDLPVDCNFQFFLNVDVNGKLTYKVQRISRSRNNWLGARELSHEDGVRSASVNLLDLDCDAIVSIMSDEMREDLRKQRHRKFERRHG